MKQYPDHINDYLSALYARRHEAQYLPKVIMEGGNWQPQPKYCHENVDIICDHMHGYEAVRGWLLFDYEYLAHVDFIQHSVVRFPDGQVVDITPSTAGSDYPFIMAKEPDCCFFEKSRHTVYGALSYLHPHIKE